MKFSTITEASVLLHKSVSTLYSDMIRRPETIPPFFKIPGTKRILFVDAEEWLIRKFLEQETNTAQNPAKVNTKKKLKGRPTNASKMVRKSQQNGEGLIVGKKVTDDGDIHG